MTKLDDFTKQMLTNPEVLKVNQESTNNRQVSNDGNLIVWAADIPGSEDKYVALFNAQSKGDDIDKKNATYIGPIMNKNNRSQKIDISIKGAKQLILFVTGAGDGFAYDRVAWVDPVLHGPDGDLKLIDLKWSSATAGSGEPRLNRTANNRPITIRGKKVEGIGTAAESTIIFDLPKGYETFSVTGMVTDSRTTAQMGVMTSKKALKLKDKADISVDLKQIGLHGKVKVRDLWRHKDIGVFKGYFTQEINQHGAGLYRISPVK